MIGERLKRILVTGGAGYIGSHCLFELENEGYEPIVYDNLSEGHKSAVKTGELIVGDLSDEKKLDTVFKEYNIDSVMHFAASCYVDESVKDPQKYFTNNVSNTLTLIKVMLANNVNKFVFSSSCAIYGEPISTPVKEEHPQNPMNPYGMSKYFIEQIIAKYARSYNFKYAALRYFNAAGASFHEGIGEDHSPETHLIPIILKACLQEDGKVKIYGGDYSTIDGTCIRDYVHVEDIVSAHILSLKAIYENDKCYIFNVGSGTGYTIKEVISVAEEITGKKNEYEIVGRRPGDVERLIASAEKINKELNWEPKYRLLSEIISSSWDWLKKNN